MVQNTKPVEDARKALTGALYKLSQSTKSREMGTLVFSLGELVDFILEWYEPAQTTPTPQLAVGDEELRAKLSDMLYANIKRSEAHRHPEFDADDFMALITQATKRAEVELLERLIERQKRYIGHGTDPDKGRLAEMRITLEWLEDELQQRLRTLTTTEPTEAKEEGGQ